MQHVRFVRPHWLPFATAIRRVAINDVYALEIDSLTNQRVSLSQHKGKVLLIVNTANERGLTPQYAGLEAVYKQLHDKGLEVLGFPCSQLGKQEPGGADGIGALCEKNYGMLFPTLGKIDVNGSNTHPLYKWLTSEKPGVLGVRVVKWNFAKFLLHRDGTVYRRCAPLTRSEEVTDDTERLLAEPDPT